LLSMPARLVNALSGSKMSSLEVASTVQLRYPVCALSSTLMCWPEFTVAAAKMHAKLASR
jgi:hypothetical protein